MHAVHGDRYREPLRHGHRRVAAAGVRLEAVQALPELGDQLAARRVHRDALLAVARDARRRRHRYPNPDRCRLQRPGRCSG